MGRLVDTVAHTTDVGIRVGGGTMYFVKTSAGVIYEVVIEGALDVVFYKSTDKGLTWSAGTTVFAGSAEALAIWYDRWSNISAGLIHCVYKESATDDLLYRTINTESSDALSTQTTIYAGVSTASGGALSVARARGGNVYCWGVIDAGVEGGFYRLTNANVPNGAWDSAATSTLTTSAAADDIIDCTAAHGLADTNTVQFATLTGGSGLVVGTEYFVIATNLSANSFMCSATRGGGAVNFTTDITAGTVRKMKAYPEAMATTDRWILVPGWAADNQDMMAFFWDASADEISRYLYDDSADSWAKTSIATSMVDVTISTSSGQFGATVDITNSRNLLVAWSNHDLLNADLRCWHITESAITEVTNVVLDSTDDQGWAVIGIDTDRQDWYVWYGGKSDGSETWDTAVNIYYKCSTDDGSTWGAETKISQQLYSGSMIWGCPRFTLPLPGVIIQQSITPQDISHLVGVDMTQPKAVHQLYGGG